LVEAKLPLFADYSVVEVIVRVYVLSHPPAVDLLPKVPPLVVLKTVPDGIVK
jgi:hypothetical protein